MTDETYCADCGFYPCPADHDCAQETDTLSYEAPVCPHCGHMDQDWSDGLPVDPGDGWEADCPSCSKPYEVETSTVFQCFRKEATNAA